MARAILNISVPESMKGYVESRADEGYDSVSDYIRKLIRRDQKKYVEKLAVVAGRQAVQSRQTTSVDEKNDSDVGDYLDVCELFRN